VQEHQIGIGDQHDALGQRNVEGTHAAANLESLDENDELTGDLGGISLDGDGVVHVLEKPSWRDLAVSPHDDLDRHLLARSHSNQVDMLNPVTHRVALHGLGEYELGTIVELEGEQGVGLLQCQHQLVGRERQVLSGLAMSVDDDGDLLVAAEPARGALAELGTTLGGDDDL
jgi:hypothetical protein